MLLYFTPKSAMCKTEKNPSPKKNLEIDSFYGEAKVVIIKIFIHAN